MLKKYRFRPESLVLGVEVIGMKNNLRLFFMSVALTLAINSPLAFSADCENQVQDYFGKKSHVISSGNYNKNSSSWNAFDGKSNTMWLSRTFQTPTWIEFDFRAQTYVNQYAIKYSNGSITSRAPKVFMLQGGNHGGWKILDKRVNESDWGGSETREFSIGDPGLFNKYRLIFEDDNDKRNGNVLISIGEIELLNCNPNSKNENQTTVLNKPFIPSNFRGKYVAEENHIELTWNAKKENDLLTNKYKIYYAKPKEKRLSYDTRIPLIEENIYKLRVPKYHSGAWKIAIAGVSENRADGEKSGVITVFVPTKKAPRVDNRWAKQEGKKIRVTWDYSMVNVPDLAGFQITLNDKIIADEKTLTATTNKWLSPSYNYEIGDDFVFKLKAITLYGVKSEETIAFVKIK